MKILFKLGFMSEIGVSQFLGLLLYLCNSMMSVMIRTISPPPFMRITGKSWKSQVLKLENGILYSEGSPLNSLKWPMCLLCLIYRFEPLHDLDHGQSPALVLIWIFPMLCFYTTILHGRVRCLCWKIFNFPCIWNFVTFHWKVVLPLHGSVDCVECSLYVIPWSCGLLWIPWIISSFSLCGNHLYTDPFNRDEAQESSH